MKIKVESYQVDYVLDYAYCDCGSKEELLLTQVLTSYPPQYVYRCTTCNQTTILRETYPCTRIEKKRLINTKVLDDEKC